MFSNHRHFPIFFLLISTPFLISQLLAEEALSDQWLS